MLVWNAMPSITPMMSAIFFDEVVIVAHRPDHLADHLRRRAPRSPDAPIASWLAWRALSAFCLTVEVSSSIDDAVSSRLDACYSVRRERSALPAAICCVAALIASAEP